MNTPHHLFVCTSCRKPGDSKLPHEQRSGVRLFRDLSERFENWARREGIVIVPVECLGVCARPCAVAMSAPGKFTYVFGDLEPGKTESAVIECATLYRRAPTGFLPREERPQVLRGAILARIPPLEVT
jgi:predicted metal-binding protein